MRKMQSEKLFGSLFYWLGDKVSYLIFDSTFFFVHPVYEKLMDASYRMNPSLWHEWHEEEVDPLDTGSEG